MNRTDAIRTATLIALPFLLFPAGIWLGHTVVATLSSMELYWTVRWSLRVIYIGGAFLGWRAGRPYWFYPWLGFAVYEAVATFFLLAFIIVEGLLDGTAYQMLVLLPLVPYIAAALWIGWRRPQRLLAAYAVFPHAALTGPLFFSFDLWAMFYDDWLGLFLSTGTAAVVAVLFWRPPPVLLRMGENWARAALLFGGVVPAQLFVLIDIGLQDHNVGMETLMALIPLACLGWLILSGPLLLPTLLQWLLGKFKAEMSND